MFFFRCPGFIANLSGAVFHDFISETRTNKSYYLALCLKPSAKIADLELYVDVTFFLKCLIFGSSKSTLGLLS